MKMTLALAALVLTSSLTFAGYDESSTTKCDNGQYSVVIKREGSFFGKNWIKLKKNGKVIVNESYSQDWRPDGDTLVEKLAQKELPCSTDDFYQMLKSQNTYVIQSYNGGTYCEEKGEENTTYIQILKTNQIVKFVNDRDCKKGFGF